jgi:hypothetical protein
MTRTRDSRRPFCFECGNQLMYVDGEPLFETRDYHGAAVRLHKECAKRWDKDKPVTAQESKP